MAAPAVSVKMAAHNHGAFIAQAIDSVLRQETTFAYELIIADDGSTDDTRPIVDEYERRHPDRITVLRSDGPLGMKQTFRRLWAACRGDQIANLDGDDYWTRTDKLQLLHDLMQAHPECAVCFHNADILRTADGSTTPSIAACDEVVDPVALLKMCFIPSCGVMVRREAVPTWPPGFDDVPMSDWPLYIIAAQRGTIRYVNQTMGVWLHHPGGAWAGGDESKQRKKITWQIQFYEWVGRYLGDRHAELVANQLATLRELASRPQGHRWPL